MIEKVNVILAMAMLVFGVVNSSSSHSDNIKNHFLISGDGDTYGINGNFGAPEKKFSINFSKVKFKADNKNVNFST